ncbi:MAG: hypothetical protein RL685_2275 [Pseudomonadota bacterium]|jgi:hypothetical protein
MMATVSEPREKILGLVASGKISPNEAELLLGALKPARARLWTWLFSPFELASPRLVWAAALLACAGSLALRPLQVHFDGAIDLHLFESAASWRVALLQQAVAWPLTALVFWLLALVSRQRAQLLELLGFVGAARIPYLLAALLAGVTRSSAQLEKGAAALILLAAALPLMVWGCVLLYHALRTATGSSGRKLGLTFFAALVLAEVASKLMLGALS